MHEWACLFWQAELLGNVAFISGTLVMPYVAVIYLIKLLESALHRLERVPFQSV